jgi:hypothetical protein
MNLPLVALIIVVATWSIQEVRAEQVSHQIDLPGVLMLAAALTTLLLGLDAVEGPDQDQKLALGLIGLSVVLFGALVLVERRAANAILDGTLLRLPPFLCSCVASFLLGLYSSFSSLSLLSISRNDLATMH